MIEAIMPPTETRGRKDMVNKWARISVRIWCRGGLNGASQFAGLALRLRVSSRRRDPALTQSIYLSVLLKNQVELQYK
jgi:hypothetical protein